MAIAIAPEIKTKLNVGEKVPEFNVQYATKDQVDANMRTGSERLLGKRYLVAFHPADWSDTCSRQFTAYKDNLNAFKDFDVEVLLVSGDYIFSRHEWAKALDLPFMMLSDHKHEMGRAFGIYDEKTGFDTRSVFLIGPDGRIEYINSKYNAENENHFNELKSAIAQNK